MPQEQSTTYRLAARIARSRNARSLALVARRILSQLNLRPHTTTSVLHDDGSRVTPDLLSLIGGRPVSPDRLRYAAAWYALTGNRPGVLSFVPNPQGQHALYRLELPRAKAGVLRSALDASGLTQRVLVRSKQGFKVWVFDGDGTAAPKVADFAQRAGVPVGVVRGDGEVMGHEEPGKARESFRSVTRAAESGGPQQLARRGPVRRYQSHDTFISSVLAHPHDFSPRYVYADWLEENGDPRGVWLRASTKLLERAQKGEIPEVGSTSRGTYGDERSARLAMLGVAHGTPIGDSPAGQWLPRPKLPKGETEYRGEYHLPWRALAAAHLYAADLLDREAVRRHNLPARAVRRWSDYGYPGVREARELAGIATNPDQNSESTHNAAVHSAGTYAMVYGSHESYGPAAAKAGRYHAGLWQAIHNDPVLRESGG